VKIVFSRKGFDAENGGVPSPIFPDGTMLSLPIPRKSPHSYGAIKSPKEEFRHLGEIVEQLTHFRMSDSCLAHLDPDLDRDSISRADGWRGIFGQSGAAQTELKKVGQGDVFLFFGQFRRTEIGPNGHLRYAQRAPVEHVIFGWLRVGDVYRLPSERAQVPTWGGYHPHLNFQIEPNPNAIYVAAERLDLSSALPGWGVFRKFRAELRLSHPVGLEDKKGKHRIMASRWQLPAWMHPWKDANARTPLTHHPKPDSWRGSDENFATLQTQSRGQEFVLDAVEYSEAWPWARGLIEMCATDAEERSPNIAFARP